MLGTMKSKEAWVEMILAERKKIEGSLAGIKLVKKIFPSDANFLLVRTWEPRVLYDYLMKAGIIVRDRSTVPRCEGCLRITVGTAEENAALLAALDVFEQQSS
jgi:histidinol-phosphate aminotransferase